MKRVFVILLLFAPLLHAQSPTGTGTANYIAKWSSTTNLTVSALCQSASGGLVGIATCSPTQRLQVNSGNMVVKGVNNFIAKGQTAKYYVGDTNHVVGATFGSGMYFTTYKAPMAMVITDATVSQDGSVVATIGMGTTRPSALVDIQAGNASCNSDGCIHSLSLFNVGTSIRVDLLGTTYLGSGDGVVLGTPLTFPDGTVQTTAYKPPAAVSQAATTRQLVKLVQQLQARVAKLEAARK